ncbi:TPA: hypothetical protein OZS76_002498 [Escherichia coli]|nr:hypothetical protein [Escherichia coli]
MKIYLDLTTPGHEEMWKGLIETLNRDYDAMLESIMPEEHRKHIMLLLLNPFLKDLIALTERVLQVEITDADLVDGVYAGRITSLTERDDVSDLVANFRRHVESFDNIAYVVYRDDGKRVAAYAVSDKAIIEHAEKHPGSYTVTRYPFSSELCEKIVYLLERDLRDVMGDVYRKVVDTVREIHLRFSFQL